MGFAGGSQAPVGQQLVSQDYASPQAGPTPAASTPPLAPAALVPYAVTSAASHQRTPMTRFAAEALLRPGSVDPAGGSMRQPPCPASELALHSRQGARPGEPAWWPASRHVLRCVHQAAKCCGWCTPWLTALRAGPVLQHQYS